MAKKIIIEVERKKTRVPVPQKPPKVEKSKKKYDRKKEMDQIRKKSKRNLNNND